MTACVVYMVCIEKNSDLNVRLPKRSARVLDSDDECSVITEISMDS